MLTDLFEIILNYYQYFALILQTEGVAFPNTWSSSGESISVANLDLDFFKNQAEMVPKDLDFRIFFILICVVVPLALNFLGLFMLNSHIVVVWFFLAMTGTMMLTAGIVGIAVPSSPDFTLDSDVAASMLVFGTAILIFCAVTLLIRKTAGCCEEEKLDYNPKGLSIKEILEIETRDCSLTNAVEYLGIVLALTIVGCIFAGLLSSTALSTHRIGINDQSFAGFTWVLGVIFISVAGVVLIYSAISWFEKGRRAQWHFSNFIQSNFMKILLIIMSVVYMPVGSGLFSMFNCNLFSCEDNQRLVDFGSYIAVNSSLDGDACTTCSLGAGQRCPSSLQDSLCQGDSDPRLEFDLGIPCKNMRTFYWPAAALVTVSFIFGVPFLFFQLIKRSCALVNTEIPVDSNIEGEEAIWAAKVASTNNVAKFLYQPFEFRFRYMRLFQILQKFVIVFTATYVFRGSVSQATISINAALAVHAFVFLCLFILAPYIVKFEDRVAYLVGGMLALAALTAELIVYDVDVPGWWTTLLIVINSAIPILALFAGAFLAYFAMKQEEQAKTHANDKAIEERCESFAAMFEAGKVTNSVYPSMPMNTMMASTIMRRSSLGGSLNGNDDDGSGSLAASMTIRDHEPSTALGRKMSGSGFNMTPPTISPRAGNNFSGTFSPRSNTATTPKFVDTPTTPSSGAGAAAGAASSPTKKKKKVVKKVVKKKVVKKKSMAGTVGPSSNANTLPKKPSAADIKKTISQAMDSDDEELSVSDGSLSDFSMSDDSDDNSTSAGSPTAAGGARPQSQVGAKPIDAMAMTLTKKPVLDPRAVKSGGGSGSNAASPNTPGSAKIPSAPGNPLLPRSNSISAQDREKLSLADRKKSFSLTQQNDGLNRTNSGNALRQNSMNDFNGTMGMQKSGEFTDSASPTERPSTTQLSPRTLKTGKGAANLAPRNPMSRSGTRPGQSRGGTQKNGPAGLSNEEDEFGMKGKNASSFEAKSWDPSLTGSGAGPRVVNSAAWDMDDDGDNGSPHSPEWDPSATRSVKDDMMMSMRGHAMSMTQRRNTEAFMATKEKYDKLLYEMMTRKKTLGITGEAAEKALIPIAQQEVEEQQAYLDEMVKDADHAINKDMRKVLNYYLMVSGMATFIALGFSFLGLLVQQTPHVHRITDAFDTSTDYHFSEYGSFENFTAKCCCMDFYPTHPQREHKVEKWVCENGARLERVRSVRLFDKGGNVLSFVDSTSSIRPMCGVNFTNPLTCSPVYKLLPPPTRAPDAPALTADELKPRYEVSFQCPTESIPAEEKALW